MAAAEQMPTYIRIDFKSTSAEINTTEMLLHMTAVPFKECNDAEGNIYLLVKVLDGDACAMAEKLQQQIGADGEVHIC